MAGLTKWTPFRRIIGFRSNPLAGDALAHASSSGSLSTSSGGGGVSWPSTIQLQCSVSNMSPFFADWFTPTYEPGDGVTVCGGSFWIKETVYLNCYFKFMTYADPNANFEVVSSDDALSGPIAYPNGSSIYVSGATSEVSYDHYINNYPAGVYTPGYPGLVPGVGHLLRFLRNESMYGIEIWACPGQIGDSFSLSTTGDGNEYVTIPVAGSAIIRHKTTGQTRAYNVAAHSFRTAGAKYIAWLQPA